MKGIETQTKKYRIIKMNHKRETLIQRLKQLIEANNIKQQKYQQNNPECGCITRETCVIASLLPQMQQLEVTFEDYQQLTSPTYAYPQHPSAQKTPHPTDENAPPPQADYSLDTTQNPQPAHPHNSPQ
jgi:hypothetical protein